MTIASTPADHRLRLGGQLFLLALTIFFAASMFLYLMFATWRREQFVEHSIPRGFIESTLLLLGTSVALVGALRAVRREQTRVLRIYLWVALGLGLAFVYIQAVAMSNLIMMGMERHPTRGLWGMVVSLAILHALHVVGGIIGLVVILVGAFRHRYDHERHWPIEFMGTYWHFLDLVWFAMLFSFWTTSNGFAG